MSQELITEQRLKYQALGYFLGMDNEQFETALKETMTDAVSFVGNMYKDFEETLRKCFDGAEVFCVGQLNELLDDLDNNVEYPKYMFNGSLIVPTMKLHLYSIPVITTASVRSIVLNSGNKNFILTRS